MPEVWYGETRLDALGDESVVDGGDEDLVDTLRLEVIVVLDKPRDLSMADTRERAGHADLYAYPVVSQRLLDHKMTSRPEKMI